MKKFTIAKEISFPQDAVTQTMAAIGRKGAGKTYLATMIAEQMLDAEAQVIVIDPVGNWWGLRVGADGKSKGKEIFVIGGEHGDVPIVPEAGARIAQLLVQKKISAVVDVSGFRLGEYKRFCAEFAEEFFHLKKSHRSPVHVFLEEAQKIIPQRVGIDEARMVGAWEQIVRLGRNYGIGCTLVTQRPQSVNKEVLSQIEVLCVLQVTGPHERKALEEWVQEAGADRTLVGELPSLQRGEGYVWSPSWLRTYKRVHFAKKTTFDASATPEVGKATKAASLSVVDVESLKTDMQDVMEQAQKDDPKKLREHIRSLEKLLAAKNGTFITKEVVSPKAVDAAVKAALWKHGKEWEKVVKKWAEFHQKNQIRLRKIGEDLMKPYFVPPTLPPFTMTPSNIEPVRPPTRVVPELPETEAGTNGSLGLAERKIYSFLFENSTRAFTKIQIAAVTGYSPTSGGFNNSLSKLRSAGLIRGSGDAITLGEIDDAYHMKGETFSAEPRFWESKLGKCEREIYAWLWERRGDIYDKRSIATATGYSETSGGFNNSLSRLNSIGLIKRVSGGIQINPEILEI